MIHWLGAGLSSGPGIRRLNRLGLPLTVWVRNPEKVSEVSEFFHLRKLEWEIFRKTIQKQDIVVSMLPASHHPEVARVCLERETHLVTTSYLSPAMLAFHDLAFAKGLCFVNEVGLDPGLDHFLAHLIEADLTKKQFDPKEVTLHFRSLCGGFPEVLNSFRYQFSWSPLGVLKALKSPATYLKNGMAVLIDKPWKGLSQLEIKGENFEYYPNRDSLPYVEQYGLANWQVKDFMRGTLRPAGWASAWEEIFPVIERGSLEELEKLSTTLAKKYAYHCNEKDRVVLNVDLEVRKKGVLLWQQRYGLDEVGGLKGSAMARLVSLPATLAVESILTREIAIGVSGAPSDITLIRHWYQKLEIDLS